MATELIFLDDGTVVPGTTGGNLMMTDEVIGNMFGSHEGAGKYAYVCQDDRHFTSFFEELDAMGNDQVPHAAPVYVPAPETNDFEDEYSAMAEGIDFDDETDQDAYLAFEMFPKFEALSDQFFGFKKYRRRECSGERPYSNVRSGFWRGYKFREGKLDSPRGQRQSWKRSRRTQYR